MVRDILRLDLAVNSVSKPLNRVEKIPNLVAVFIFTKLGLKLGFTVHVNSDKIFLV